MAAQTTLLSVRLLLLAVGLFSFVARAAPGEDFAPVRVFRWFDRRSTPGLPQSTAASLLQDEKGMLWIGTLDGLASFDGRSFQSVPKDPQSPSSGPIYGLARRKGGGIWAAGMRGVFELDGRRWRLRRSTRTLIRAKESPDGWLWAVGQDGAVYRMPREAADGAFTEVRLAGERGVDLDAFADGRLVLATDSCLYELKGTGIAAFPRAGLPGALSTALVTRGGALWAGTSEGELYFLAPGAKAWKRLESLGPEFGHVRDLKEDLRGRVWAAGNDGSVAFGVPGQTFTRWGPANGLKKTAVVSLLADREGTVWFGLNAAGLQQWVGEAWSHRVRWEKDDRPEDVAQLFGLSATADGFVAAVFHRGIWRWDGRSMAAFGREDGLTEDVRHAVEPQPGILWAGARNGLFESRDGGPFRKVLPLARGFVNGLFRSPGGTWYAATSADGIYTLAQGRWVKDEVRSAALPDSNVRAMAWAGDELWAGTLHGLAVFAADGSPRPRESLPAVGIESINALLARESGEVWVGGFGGVSVWKGGSAKRLGVPEGVPGDTVYALAEALDGSVWVGGSAGVSRFLHDRVAHYDSRSGLISEECNSLGLLPLRDGTVLAATMASLARFDPGLAPQKKPPLQVFLDEPATSDGTVRLPAARRQLVLRWRAPWLDPTPVQFRTRIQRLAPDWSEPSLRNELHIENTPPGRWTVEVQARLAGQSPGDWSPVLTVNVEAQRQLWEMPFVQALGLSLLGLAVVGLVRWRTRRLARRAAELDAEVSRRTAELVEANRKLQEAQEALHELARRDALTGLYNRRAAEERLHEAAAASRRQPAPLSAFLFDIDYFKDLNDRDGHAAGDAILRRVADAIRREVRENDVAVRYGGDEFLILFPGVDEEGAYHSAERLRAVLREACAGPSGGPPIFLSGGVATLPLLPDSPPEALIEAADRALYAAKRAGRDRVERASQAPAPEPVDTALG